MGEDRREMVVLFLFAGLLEGAGVGGCGADVAAGGGGGAIGGVCGELCGGALVEGEDGEEEGG